MPKTNNSNMKKVYNRTTKTSYGTRQYNTKNGRRGQFMGKYSKR